MSLEKTDNLELKPISSVPMLPTTVVGVRSMPMPPPLRPRMDSAVPHPESVEDMSEYEEEDDDEYYDEVYDDGYAEGYKDGHDRGYREGIEAGRVEGITLSYAQSRTEGYANTSEEDKHRRAYQQLLKSTVNKG